ncbi:imidazole glycerol phosphate synthase subunit HisH [Gottfriedia acidiceleris]|uniref:Imidazole glycerol phosphate synthase subunit HisH n=1 Tax=Gottfriedia acidiceleris TaxID=371036 RepID=A0ABY4JJB3_9BACI|nr:imidazole glycerol phosphate synthase subunit HisH [Gottfriedia acidiceleris]UPM52953.1 imidazole glycerol phosphate synthase subunit HisH [Gottfriedia acidiceleris]
MNIIIDYGVGNLDSLKRACEEIDFPVVITNEIDVIEQASSIILPGVGAYEAAMNELNRLGLVNCIKSKAKSGTPILGICLGMQLLYEFSEENIGVRGLGLIKGQVKRIPDFVKVPHMGWNKLNFTKVESLLKYINQGDYVYFVHSFYISSTNDELLAYSEYGVKIPAIIKSDNIYGMQFHPEKSAETGLKLLKAFKEMCIYDSISSN